MLRKPLQWEVTLLLEDLPAGTSSLCTDWVLGSLLEATSVPPFDTWSHIKPQRVSVTICICEGKIITERVLVLVHTE